MLKMYNKRELKSLLRQLLFALKEISKKFPIGTIHVDVSEDANYSSKAALFSQNERK